MSTKFVLLSGESGSGKSSYAQRFADMLGDEAGVIQLPFKANRTKRPDWKKRCFEEVRKIGARHDVLSGVQICFVDVTVPGPLEISFERTPDAFNARGESLFVRSDAAVGYL
jgi:energy-coupling factor transporter ATP-binding protein EcfA2